MSELLRKLVGPYMDEADAGDAGAAGGADAGKGEAAAAAGGDEGALETEDGQQVPDDTKTDPKTKAVPVEKQMLAGIEAAMAPKTEEDKAAKPDAGKPAAKPGEKPDAGKPAAAEKKESKDELKGKKADDFKLTPEIEAVLKPEARKRFMSLTALAKQHEGTIEAQNTVIGGLTKARDQIMGVMEESHCTPADLGPLLDFNFAVKTGKLEDALAMVDGMRKQILTRMGKEAPGVDLLDGYPELQQQVADEAITRSAAIEIATRRRDEQARTDHARRSEEVTRQAGAVEQRRETALGAIEKWTKEISAGDIDYKAKEERFLTPDPKTKKSRLDSIMARLWDRPEEWLPALQDVYGAIEVMKPAHRETPAPLRPSGARGGNRESTFGAAGIAAEMGYNLDTMK